MIQPNELRIGSIILTRDGINAVTALNDGNVYYEYKRESDGRTMYVKHGIEHAIGIPLNAEILVKCGFIKAESSDDQERPIYTIQIANNHSLYFDPENPESDEFWYISLQWNNNHYKNSFWQFPEYLHQLQNLCFALTGEELNVNL